MQFEAIVSLDSAISLPPGLLISTTQICLQLIARGILFIFLIDEELCLGSSSCLGVSDFRVVFDVHEHENKARYVVIDDACWDHVCSPKVHFLDTPLYLIVQAAIVEA